MQESSSEDAKDEPWHRTDHCVPEWQPGQKTSKKEGRTQKTVFTNFHKIINLSEDLYTKLAHLLRHLFVG